MTSILFLLAVWTAMILVFACAYVAIDTGNSNFCGLGKGDDPIKFGPAFAFSLETWYVCRKMHVILWWQGRTLAGIEWYQTLFLSFLGTYF